MNKKNQENFVFSNQNGSNNKNASFQNAIYWGDNLSVLRELYKNSTPFIDLIYIDPPFNSNRNYHIQYADYTTSKSKKQTFSDTWNKNHNKCDNQQNSKLPEVDAELHELSTFTDVLLYDFFIKAGNIMLTTDEHNYLVMLSVRLYYIHKLLKDTGSLYLHCDPNMSHYIKVILDIIFGKENYQNEIAWCYKSGGSTKRRFAKKHDTILFYSKTDKYKFNPIKDKSYIKEKFGFKNAQHLLHEDEGGYYTYANARDYWQLDIIGRSSDERLGYPTQKPEMLLERIILASSEPNDIVADFFCGSGTTLSVAQKLGRRWCAVDKSSIGLRFLRNRIEELNRASNLKAVNYLEYGTPKLEDEALSLYNSDFDRFRSWLIEYIFGGHDANTNDLDDVDDIDDVANYDDAYDNIGNVKDDTKSDSTGYGFNGSETGQLFCYAGHIVFTSQVGAKKNEQIKFSCLIYIVEPSVTIDEEALNEMLDEELWGLTDDVRLVVHFGKPFVGYIVKPNRFNAPIISTISVQEILNGHLPLWFTKFNNSTY